MKKGVEQIFKRLDELQPTPRKRFKKTIGLSPQEAIIAHKVSMQSYRSEQKVIDTNNSKKVKKKIKVEEKSTEVKAKTELRITENQDFCIFLPNLDCTKEFKVEFLSLNTDIARQELLDSNPEFKESYIKAQERYIEGSYKEELMSDLDKLQQEGISLVEPLLVSDENEPIKKAFEVAVGDINTFKSEETKTAKIKKNYIIAVKILEKLTAKTGLKLMELFEIGESEHFIKEKLNSETQLMHFSFDNIIERIKELREKINNETKQMRVAVTEAKNKVNTFAEDMYHCKISASQTPKFINKKWSELSQDDKRDRLSSIIYHKLRLQLWNKIIECCGEKFAKTYTLPIEHEEMIVEFAESFS